MCFALREFCPPGGYWNRRGQYFDIYRCYHDSEQEWWEVAGPDSWSYHGRYFWPKKGRLHELKAYEREALAYNFDGYDE